MTRVLSLVLSATLSGLVSCAAVSKVGQSSATLVKNATSQVSKLSEAAIDKVRPAQIKVVEVREKDLKEMPTGEQQALAYEKTRKRSFWFFDGPVDFKEPTLPEPGGEMDNSLLPPKSP
ncbi:MAG: hypothetical protein V4640_03920 [Verrucomicrobiota bacterium]